MSHKQSQEPYRQAPGHDQHCFVVMPFGHTAAEARWFKGWFDVVIGPAVRAAGYEPKLAATEEQPSAINDDIRAHLAFDPMVVVDLGGTTPNAEPNPNVMYELGIRHALGLPLVMMAWKDQRLPFDVGNQRVIMEDRELVDLEINKERLVNFIKAAEKGKYYKPMDAVGRAATLDLAPDALSEDSLLVALVQEVKELRKAVTAGHVLKLETTSDLEAVREFNSRSSYVPEETASTIARYLLARLPGTASLSDDVANEIATMLIWDNKPEAVHKLCEQTGLDATLAHDILTQVNVLRAKDDLLRSIRLS